MNEIRRINKVIKSKPTVEGAGVHLNRAIGFDNPYEYDPFLLFDDFSSDNPENYVKGFPWHPHRGIETITYVLSGSVEHKDSIGNTGKISEGDMQWMTAGSGIYHEEMPVGAEGGKLKGFQLWANLPSEYKMMKPRYRDIKASMIPVIKKENGVEIRVIAGAYDGIAGPIKDVVIEPEYFDLYIPEGQTFIKKTNRGNTVFAYVMEGSGIFRKQDDPYDYIDINNKKTIGKMNLVLFDDGDYIEITAVDSSIRLLLISGQPINEEIAWYGPIVMNTREELNIAFQELERGTFIKENKI